MRWLPGFVALLLACGLPDTVIDRSTDEPTPMVGATVRTVESRAIISTDYAAVNVWDLPAELAPHQNNSMVPSPQVDERSPILGPGLQVELSLSTAAATVGLNAAGRDQLAVLVSPLTNFDPQIEIIGSAGPLFVQDERAAGEPEIVILDASAGERFTLAVRGGQSEGDRFRLAVFGSVTEMFDRVIDLTDGVEEDGINRHRVFFTAGRPVLIRLEPEPDSDMLLELYDSSAIILALDDGFVGEAEQLLYVPQETAEHVIAVYGFQFQPGGYRLIVDQIK